MTRDVLDGLLEATGEASESHFEHRRPSPGKVSLTAGLRPGPRVQGQADAVMDGGLGALVRPVQLHGAGEDPARIQRAVQRGVAAPASDLPFRSELERAFGPTHDLSNVRAHVGGDAEASAREMGANAYASGRDVVLPSNPSLHLVAHEVTHTIQQQGGIQLSDGVGRVGDAYEREADEIAERVTRGERVGHLLSHSHTPVRDGHVQRQVAPQPPGSGPSGYVDTKADLNVPNRDQLIEITNEDASKRFSVVGQLKVVLPPSPVATATASGTVDAGAAGDHDASAKIDGGVFQQRGTLRTKETAESGRRFTSRLAMSLAKPGGKLTAFPGLTVEMEGDLGQLNFQNGQLDVGSINFSVKGDVTKWVLGDDAKRAGIRVELVAQIKMRLYPDDLKVLGRMASGLRQLQKSHEAARKMRVVIQAKQAQLARVELALSKAMGRRVIDIALVRKLEQQAANVRRAIAVRAGALKAIRSQAKVVVSAMKGSASRLAAAGARIVGKQVLNVASQLVEAILMTVNAALIIVDLLQIGLAIYRIADGTAEAKLGGGGPGGMLKKGVPGGTVPDGNAETQGAPDATGTGPGTGNDAAIAPDAGGDRAPNQGEGTSTSASADGSNGGSDDGVSGDDGAAGDPGAPIFADDVSPDLDEDGADDVDAIEDDGGLGTSAPQRPDGGPGAGANTGSKPSFDSVAGTDVVDRNAKPDDTSSPPPNATPADTSGAAAHDGSVAASSSGGNGDAGSASEPAELVTNPNALRIMSALDGLGQPATPEIIALVESLIPADLTPDEVDALIDELMLWLVPGDQATDETTIVGLTEGVTTFLQRRDQARRDRSKGQGAGGGGGTSQAKASGAATSDGGKARGKHVGKTIGRKDKSADRGRVVLKGKGLTPTVFEDGTFALTQEQAGQWLALDGDAVAMSDEGAEWLASNRDLRIKTKPSAMRLMGVVVSGARNDGGNYDATITFTLERGAAEMAQKAVRFTWTPDAPKGKRAEITQTVSLESLERLVVVHAFTATVQTDIPVDLGAFSVKVVHVHNAPYFDGTPETPLTFLLTLEIVAVRDVMMSTYRGHPVRAGVQLTESFSLRPVAR